MPVRKKRDRFNGMPEEEVIKRVLPDHLAVDLDIVIVSMGVVFGKITSFLLAHRIQHLKHDTNQKQPFICKDKYQNNNTGVC